MDQLVRGLEASEEARRRVRVVLLTLLGQWRVQDGCDRLGIGRTRFQDLRRAMLQAAVEALECGAPGRPRAQHRGERAPKLEEKLRQARRRLQLRETELELERLGLGDTIRARKARQLVGA